MRNWKLAVPFACFVLIAVVGVGASLAQTETPTAPTTSDSTEAPAATAEATTASADAMATPEATDRPRAGMGLPMMPSAMMQGAMTDVVNAALDAIAQQTGMSKDDIVAAVQQGQTVAELVKAKNGDLQAVIDAIVKAATDKITAAVTAGTLTQAQADKVTANLTQIITNAVNGKFPMMMGGMRGMGNGPMGGPMNGGPNGNWPNGPMGGNRGQGGSNPWFNGPMGGNRGQGGFNPWFGMGNGPTGGGFGNRGGMNMGGGMGMNASEVLFAAITNATKLKERDLLRQLRQGKSLADIITANGSTVDAVVTSAVAAETDFINGRVELGLISRDDADKRIAGLKDRFTQLLNRQMPGPRRYQGGNPMASPEATTDATQAVSA